MDLIQTAQVNEFCSFTKVQNLELSDLLRLDTETLQSQLSKAIQNLRNNKKFELKNLKSRFSLTDEEYFTLIFCYLFEANSSYTEMCRFNNRFYVSSIPTLDYICRLVQLINQKTNWYLSETSVLWKLNLIDIVEALPSLRNQDRSVKLNARIFRYIQDDNETIRNHFFSNKNLNNVLASNESEKEFIKISLENLGRKNIAISGSDVFHRLNYIENLALKAGFKRVLTLDLDSLSASNTKFIIAETIKEAVLTDSLIVSNLKKDFDQSFSFKILREILDFGWPIIISVESEVLFDEYLHDVISVKLTIHTEREQFAFWKNKLATSSDSKIKNLVECYSMSLPKINAILEQFPMSENTVDQVIDYISHLKKSYSPAGVKKIEIYQSTPNLIFSADKQNEFDNMLRDISQRRSVLSEWGFDLYFKNRTGVNILFYGPSGTGKTHATEQVARSLGKNLYKVDLSSLVSKYIGETEKNIENIFQELVGPANIVFFDEADSLFAQRSEQKTSNDRFSNMEINYLLQRIESHSGYVILASNLERNIDAAFCRRFDYWMQFDIPSSAERLLMWKSAFPNKTPIGNLDFDLLADKMSLVGAQIRKIAFSAALSAKSQNKSVEMNHIVEAASLEHKKSGQFFSNPLEENQL